MPGTPGTMPPNSETSAAMPLPSTGLASGPGGVGSNGFGFSPNGGLEQEPPTSGWV
ncbi:Uncharacterised protein [Mycobacteroides abscessus subsp. abscessus]|nr:Uncharacterised protein [Mycobacteroides abscessus subsp. abscessus]